MPALICAGFLLLLPEQKQNTKYKLYSVKIKQILHDESKSSSLLTNFRVVSRGSYFFSTWSCPWMLILGIQHYKYCNIRFILACQPPLQTKNNDCHSHKIGVWTERRINAVWYTSSVCWWFTFSRGKWTNASKTRDLHPTTSNCCQIKIGVSDFSFCLHANISLTTNK